MGPCEQEDYYTQKVKLCQAIDAADCCDATTRGTRSSSEKSLSASAPMLSNTRSGGAPSGTGACPVISLPYQHRRHPRPQSALDRRQNLRFVLDEHVVVGGKGGSHLIQVVELAVEDEDIAIDLGVESGAPDLVWLECRIAFGRTATGPSVRAFRTDSIAPG